MENTHRGVNVWAPVLGNGNLSVLRELHDYSRALALMQSHERLSRRGIAYTRVVFSRLEYEWLADHPPLSLLPLGDDGQSMWLPSGGVSSGVNDRHALMSRAAADVYFRRWQLLLSPNLFERIPERIVLNEGPEVLLMALLHASQLRVRYFPSTMLLGCCGKRSFALGRCYGRTMCVERPRLRVRGGTRYIGAKYFDELKFTERHAAALACPGAHYMGVGREAARKQSRRGAHPREPGVVIALPAPPMQVWHPDPKARAQAAAATGGWRGVRRMTLPIFSTFVRAVPMSDSHGESHGEDASAKALVNVLAPPGGGAPSAGLTDRLAQCPLLPRHWWPLGAVRGFCDETSEQGDCAAGDKGNFPEFERRGLFRGELVSIHECARLCSGCARCRYFSVATSPDAVDCSWYHSCDLTHTRELSHANFVSMSLDSAQGYERLCRAKYGEGAC